MWEYNHSTGFWTRLHAGGSTPADASAPTVPPPRVGHAAVVLQGDLWIFGGYDPDAGDMNDLWKFDRSEGTWSQAAPLGGGAERDDVAGDAKRRVRDRVGPHLGDEFRAVRG